MKQPVMWVATYEQEKHKWKRWLIYSNLFLITICGICYTEWLKTNHISTDILTMTQEIKTYRTRNQILYILRTKGISLAQGLDIADMLILQSKKQGIPLSLGIAIMARESEFRATAISDTGKTGEKAHGLMQLLPSTFNFYNTKLKLGLHQSAIFDPIVNIYIAFLHLRDLVAEISPRIKSDEELWDGVLERYSGGTDRYSQKVKKMQKEIENKFRNGEI